MRCLTVLLLNLKFANDKQQNRNNQNMNNQLWIVGTSIVKDVKKNLMYKSRKVQITTLGDKTLQGALDLIEDKGVNTANILYQVGSNDLDETGPDFVVEKMEELIVKTKKINPDTNILISELLPRFYKNPEATKRYEEKREKCNSLLFNLCAAHDIKYIEHDNLSFKHFYDGIHLHRKRGVGIYILNIKKVTNPILGVQNSMHAWT